MAEGRQKAFFEIQTKSASSPMPDCAGSYFFNSKTGHGCAARRQWRVQHTRDQTVVSVAWHKDDGNPPPGTFRPCRSGAACQQEQDAKAKALP